MKFFLSLLLTASAMATMALGAGKPNFSGQWKMDPAQSNLGPVNMTSMDWKVDHREPKITVVESQSGATHGDATTTSKYTTDGKETSNSLMGADSKSTATWDGEALVITTDAAYQGASLHMTSRWTLSADGKTLTDTISAQTPQGGADIVFVFAKQ